MMPGTLPLKTVPQKGTSCPWATQGNHQRALTWEFLGIWLGFCPLPCGEALTLASESGPESWMGV